MTAWREFHVSRDARDRYQFDQSLFATSGAVVFADFHAAMMFAQQMNDRRDLLHFPEAAVMASHINAMGMIDEMCHVVVAQYQEQANPDVLAEALAWLEAKLGRAALDTALRRFTDAFPPVEVYRRERTVDDYLSGSADDLSSREVALEELLMLWLSNMNPAFAPYLELFDDARLEQETAYPSLIEALEAFFKTRPPFGPDNQSLIDMLRAPALAAPHSLFAQLEYMRTRWRGLIGKHLYRLLNSLDFIKEQEKPVFFGPGPAQVPVYDKGAPDTGEAARYSPDLSWMPKVVLLAKNAHVWLDQLSRTYQRPITRLDHIPDEELDTLARRGITGLWLIGLWERSAASQRIKKMCGNPEAAASAYSLFHYEIAQDLGGPEALAGLKARVDRRGIRLASDMVPNHMGLDSPWVVAHPDRFIALDAPPFPVYSFTGSNLSGDDRVGLYLEDHYYDRSDAAVVFKRVDRQSGHEQYIYHGNDGTNMPWNDTAQLNFLNPEVREAVIRTILHVARQFSIIRFDAAMTLTKRHYQRLWFPEPGGGGAIPSRAEHGLTRRRFDEAMPQEFWREVVDRVAQETPDTLLLAEAFWLMEGYFVRTLGMHRVYNSAFMHMLRDEENAKYRQVIKNTLEFDPEVLKRFVNFMNNPDEETAIEQFGTGDKYFGVCTLLVTLPGLPMLGHGQIEGFTEKYGMEYRRAYRDELPDQALVERHEREIFPLLHLRHLFAEVRDFCLFDFWTPDGHVNEDVFAYSNRSGDERALVVYHNRFADTRGWVRASVGFAVLEPDGERRLMQRTLGEALALHRDDARFTVFRDAVTGLEYIRPSRTLYEQGLYVELGAYRYHVFMHIREVVDNEAHAYAHLTGYLNGRGVPDLEAAMREVLLQPVHHAFNDLVHAGRIRRLMQGRVTRKDAEVDANLLDEVEEQALALVRAIHSYRGQSGDPAPVARDIRDRTGAVLRLSVPDEGDAGAYLRSRLDGDPAVWGALLGWVFVHALGRTADGDGYVEQSRSWLDEWHFGRMLAGTLQDLGLDAPAAEYHVAVVKVLTAHQRWFEQGAAARPTDILTPLFRDPDVHRVLQINRHRDVLWYNREAFEHLLWWLFATAVVACRTASPEQAEDTIRDGYATVRLLKQASDDAGYRVEALLDGVHALENENFTYK